MNATRIVYTIRVSESAYMEVSPDEITEFIAQGFVPDIQVMATQ